MGRIQNDPVLEVFFRNDSMLEQAVTSVEISFSEAPTPPAYLPAGTGIYVLDTSIRVSGIGM